jgi:hypothetical protein
MRFGNLCVCLICVLSVLIQVLEWFAYNSMWRQCRLLSTRPVVNYHHHCQDDVHRILLIRTDVIAWWIVLLETKIVFLKVKRVTRMSCDVFTEVFCRPIPMCWRAPMPPPSESIPSTFDCNVEVCCNSKTLVCTYKTTPCHISEEENTKLRCGIGHHTEDFNRTRHKYYWCCTNRWLMEKW